MKEIKKIENLVIGGNLAALEFAFREGFPIFYEKLEVPFRLEQTKDGLSKKNILQNYAFLLSLAGLNYNTFLNGEHRLEDKKLIITGKQPWITEIHFEQLYDFTKTLLDEETTVKVVDYINVRSCGSHDIRELKTEESFVKEIYFYPSKRVNSSKNFSLLTHNYETTVKDAMVVSYIKRKDLHKEEYSEIYSRLKLKETMEAAGIVGKRRGTRPNGKVIRSSIELEFAKREVLVIEEQKRNYYYTSSKNTYLNKLIGYIYGRNSKTKKN